MTAPRKQSVLPGFGITLGFTIFYLSLIVLIPLTMLFIKSSQLSVSEFINIMLSRRVLTSFRLSLATAALAAVINAVLGLIVAWVLERYPLPGKKIIDVLVDLPFALPTAVAGITLTSLYAPTGALGVWLGKLGIKAAYSPLGIVIALTFIGLPFVVRSVQPVLVDLEHDVEEAAACLGASRWQTFKLVVWPALFPAVLSGAGLAFARAVGEYGSVVFISGNMPMKTEVVPFLIMTKLEQYDYAGATAIALMMLAVSFGVLLLMNITQWRYENKDADHAA